MSDQCPSKLLRTSRKGKSRKGYRTEEAKELQCLNLKCYPGLDPETQKGPREYGIKSEQTVEVSK